MTAVTHPRTPSLEVSAFRGARLYIWITGLALILAIASLAYPSTPSYDPWSWLIWGRQILHGHLWIAGGSSWKPLPVIFTTVFAIFGSAQPNLWLIVARAGALMSVLMSAKLATRITWGFVARGREPGWFAELGVIERLATLTPVVLTGAIAVIGTAFMPRYPVPMLLGYSEGLGFAITLVAIERAWDGHHRQAFALGLLPCLDRPELWIVWGLYGLWLMWRNRRTDRTTVPFVLGLGVLMLALWVGPQKVGGGKLSELFSHAQNNHLAASAVNSSFPFWHELYKVIWPLALERVEAAALIAIVVAAFLVTRDRRAQGGWKASARRHGPAVAAALAAAAGFLWWIGISLETQAGFAGNPRYTVLGVLLVYVGGASAYGWACLGIVRGIGALASRWRGRQTRLGLRLAVAGMMMTVVFLFVPSWFAHRLPSINSVRYALRYQARLREQVANLVQRAGGAQNVMRCGSVMTNNYEVTLLAWYLDVPIPYVQAVPRKFETKDLGPNVVFQDGATSDTAKNISPTDAQLQAWNLQWQKQTKTQYKVTRTDPVILYTDCSKHSAT
ncbi:MAG TPA: hypothetical protein VG228_04140 [Solirubrobacteraceae bacterium]|jgi:hypothetical protein|nr:hypothetical protein [Solirubrobacteraceae bacterium]